MFLNKNNLFFYFALVILIGSILLYLPFSWKGDNRLSYIDALFISTSAVSVTGLSTIDIPLFSVFGKLIIMILIQIGGLGLIAFTSLYIIRKKKSKKISLISRKMISEYFLSSVEFNPYNILKNIILTTIIFESIGSFILFILFLQKGLNFNKALFYAVFHSISAFNNAGFSLYDNNLTSLKNDPLILIVIAILFNAGGLGFVVFTDLLNYFKKFFKNKKVTLKLHSQIVLLTSFFLLLIPTFIFLIVEYNNTLKDLDFDKKIVNSFFLASSPRTAGFNSLDEAQLLPMSIFLTIFLMLIGGGSGSAAGGIKVTTFFVLILILYKKIDENGDIRLKTRTISKDIIYKSNIFLLRALSIMMISTFLLMISEFHNFKNGVFTTEKLIFEVISSLSTVGLSLNITSYFNPFSKLILILTMFIGRLGLVSMTLQTVKNHQRNYYLPKEDILIG